MKSLTIVLPAIALLAACNSAPSVRAENASIAEVTAATRDAVKLEPGKWETTVAILSMDGPGLPPAMAAAMKKQMKPQTAQSCLTAEQVASPPQDMLGLGKSCSYEKFAITGGTMDGTLVCKNMPGMQGGAMRASIAGKFAGTSYDVTSVTTMDMPAMPGAPGGGKVTTRTHVLGKRVGACDTPKAS